MDKEEKKEPNLPQKKTKTIAQNLLLSSFYSSLQYPLFHLCEGFSCLHFVICHPWQPLTLMANAFSVWPSKSHPTVTAKSHLLFYLPLFLHQSYIYNNKKTPYWISKGEKENFYQKESTSKMNSLDPSRIWKKKLKKKILATYVQHSTIKKNIQY